MALDYRAIITNGTWPDVGANDETEASLFVSFGLWGGPFPALIVVISGHRIRIIGFQFDGKLIG